VLTNAAQAIMPSQSCWARQKLNRAMSRFYFCLLPQDLNRGSTTSRFCKRQHSKIVTVAPQAFMPRESAGRAKIFPFFVDF